MGPSRATGSPRRSRAAASGPLPPPVERGPPPADRTPPPPSSLRLERVHHALAAQDLGAVLAPGDAAQRRDRLVRSSRDDLRLGRDRVADVRGRRVIPLLVEE